MIRNIFDHSESEYFYYGSQYVPSQKIVEIVFSDRGVGLKETIQFNIEEWSGLDTVENAKKRLLQELLMQVIIVTHQKIIGTLALG